MVHILQAQADSFDSVEAEDVSTSAVSGAANVEEALTVLNSNIQTSQWQILDTEYATIRIRKAGNVAMLWIYSDKAISANTEIGEVPSSYRFSGLPYPYVIRIRDGIYGKKIKIEDNGKITCVDDNPSGDWIVANATWVID